MKMLTWTKQLLQPIKRFREDQDGAVTMEFVIMLPLLFTWAVGSFLYYDAYRSLSITNKVGFTIADIASRYEEIDDDDIASWQELAERMLPFRNVNHRLRVSSICFYDGTDDGNSDQHHVVWSNVQNKGEQLFEADGTTPVTDADGNAVYQLNGRDEDTIPEDMLPLMADQDTVLYVELYSTWRPLSNSIFGLSFTEKTWFVDLMIRPRFVQSIPYTMEDGTVLDTPCTYNDPPVA